MSDTSAFDNPKDLLAALAGEWRGTTKTFLEPWGRDDESPWSGRISLILDGKFAFHEYDGAIGGKGLSGKALFAYDKARKQWEIAWVDSFHTGGAILFSTGGEWKEGETSSSFSVLGSYPDGQGGPDWGWRTEVRVDSPDRIVIAHFNITPDGEESLGVETVYDRA
ncbi:MAG: DUF1579 family protein [bacterium]|jgi:hypothetical protein